MQFEKRAHKQFNKKNYDFFILAGDVGGTNTSLGIFGIKNNLPTLLLSFHFRSKELKGLHYAINEVLFSIKKNYGIGINAACLAIAGILSPSKDRVKMTNINLNPSRNELLKRTKLKKIFFINDFEAVGYGINFLAKKDIIAVKRSKKVSKAPVLVIGAGTGLGKTTLIYSKNLKCYAPIASEAGHSDFAAQSKFEYELTEFIKKYKKVKNVSYEEVLSGRGLVSIYLFLKKSGKFKETGFTKEVDKSKNKPELISRYKNTDATCKKTFEVFKAAYANFAKNFALDSLAFGGVYIAGGISIKNKEIFDNNFVKIFEDNTKMKSVLSRIPIYLISNQNVGLLGAGFYCAKLLK